MGSTEDPRFHLDRTDLLETAAVGSNAVLGDEHVSDLLLKRAEGVLRL